MVPGRWEHQHDVHPDSTADVHLDGLSLGVDLPNQLLNAPCPRLDLEEDDVSSRS